MDLAYLHLLVNHLPIILTGLGTAAVLLALFTKRRPVWLYAVATLTLAGMSAPVSFFTGRGAEGVMEERWYVVKQDIHEHEEAAEVATIVLLGMGALSGYAFWRMTRRAVNGAPGELPTWLRALVVAGAMLGMGSVTVAAYKGGQIVHESPHLEKPPVLLGR